MVRPGVGATTAQQRNARRAERRARLRQEAAFGGESQGRTTVARADDGEQLQKSARLRPEAAVSGESQGASAPDCAADGKEELRHTEASSPTTGKVAVKILADDILPLHKNLDALKPAPLGSQPSLGLATGLGLPPLLYLIFMGAMRRKQKFAQDSGLRRRREAFKTARKDLEGLSSTDKNAAAQQASLCLRRYIGDKLGLEGSALTATEVQHHLQEQGVEDNLVQETVGQLAQLESAQYSAASVDASGLREKIETLLKRLEGALK